MLSVALFTDQPLISLGLKALLMDSLEMRLSGVWREIGRLAEDQEGVAADILVIDMGPQVDLAVLRRLCHRSSQSRVVILVRNISPEMSWQLRECGVFAIVPTTASVQQIAAALRRVAAGEFVFEGVTKAAEASNALPVNLTPRESQLVSLLTQGLKNKEIATALGITEGTVKVYLSKLFQKVGAKDRFDLALSGLKNMFGEPVGFQHEPPAVMAQPVMRHVHGELHSLVVRKAPVPAAPRYFSARFGS